MDEYVSRERRSKSLPKDYPNPYETDLLRMMRDKVVWMSTNGVGRQTKMSFQTARKHLQILHKQKRVIKQPKPPAIMWKIKEKQKTS